MQIVLVLSQFRSMTESIFPEVYKLLAEIEFQQALEYIGWQKRMERYRSMGDFLFCELFPSYKPGCWRFYADKGPQLKQLITERQRATFEKVMLVSLIVARGAHEQRVRTTWADFQQTVFANAA